MAKFCNFLSNASLLFLGLSIIHFGIGAFSFVPAIRRIDDIFYAYPYIGAALGMGGFVAGILGILLLLLYVIMKLKKKDCGLRPYRVLVPILGGILWAVYFYYSLPV